MTFKFCKQAPALTSIGVDIGNNVFHIVGLDRDGLTRGAWTIVTPQRKHSSQASK